MTSKTPMHSFRVSHEIWNAAKAKAAAEGTTLTEVLRRFLVRYARRK